MLNKILIILFLSISLNYAQFDIIDPSVVIIEPTKMVSTEVTTNKIPYHSIIKKHTATYALLEQLVMALIKEESNYRAKARSHKGAIGLMQIVPKSAGREVWGMVYGSPKTPSVSFLYKPYNNIKFGCAYLSILENKYFNGVEDSLSRRYCMIAAYNTGPSNVARAFVSYDDIVSEINYNEYKKLSDKEKLKVRLSITISKINRMSSYEVHHTLKNNLPYMETVYYLDNVLNSMRQYENN
jgi:membrane-bound lytic murein transglycosylase C